MWFGFGLIPGSFQERDEVNTLGDWHYSPVLCASKAPKHKFWFTCRILFHLNAEEEPNSQSFFACTELESLPSSLDCETEYPLPTSQFHPGSLKMFQTKSNQCRPPICCFPLLVLPCSSVLSVLRMARVVRVRVAADVNCPWCWVGKRSLDKAIANSGAQVEVIWQPFIMDPTTPAEAVNQNRVEINLIPGSKVANTMNAHRLLHYTLTHYGSVAQNQVAEILFHKTHKEGRNVGDKTELYAAAKEAGFTAPQLQEQRTYLELDKDRDLIAKEDAANKRKGVSGVPHFQFEGMAEGISGGQPPQVFQRIIQQLSAARP